MTADDRISFARAAERVHDNLLHDLTPTPLPSQDIKRIAQGAADFVQAQIEEAMQCRLQAAS